MFMTRRSALRSLSAALTATQRSFAKPTRAYRHALTREDSYRVHMQTMLGTVMGNMATILCKGNKGEAAKLLKSLNAPKA